MNCDPKYIAPAKPITAMTIPKTIAHLPLEVNRRLLLLLLSGVSPCRYSSYEATDIA
jgi:hypothetical protein